MMQSYPMFHPMFAMFIWTVLMFLRAAALRVRAVRSGQVSIRYFEVFQGTAPPEILIKATNHVNNLCQIPPLFYVIGLFISVAGLADPVFVILGWAYVFARMIHSMIHVTYNKVMHRFLAFITSNIILVVLWVRTMLIMTGVF